MCFDAIIAHDIRALGESMNECMLCWEQILPGTVHYHTIKTDLMSLLKHYPFMYSGCGGDYLYVVSNTQVSGAFHIKVRTVDSRVSFNIINQQVDKE